MKAFAITLIVSGLGLSIFLYFNFFTTEKMAQICKLKIKRQKPHYISWTPINGIALRLLGGAVLWNSSKKSQY